jgi:acyl carrier protein
VKLVPAASVTGTGETVVHPKPSGIVLQPLTAAPPTVPLAQPHVPLTPVAAPEPVTKPVTAGADVSRAATIPSDILCEALAASLAEALFLEREEVALDKPFTELGLDSIVAVEWVRALNTRYRTSLTVTRVYDYPTILTFAAFLERELEPQAPAPVALSPSLDDVLQRVQQGHLDIAQAYQLLQQIDVQNV